MRTKHTFRLPPDLAGKLADYAARKSATQSLVVEAALASHLSPDGADRLEAALARRLDRISRQMERLERHVDISNEALALFVRFWLTSNAANAGRRTAGGAGERAGALQRFRRGARSAPRATAQTCRRNRPRCWAHKRVSGIQAAARPDLRERHPCRL